MLCRRTSTSTRRSHGITTPCCSPSAAYWGFLSQGWTDAIRALHPNEPMYTFWDYMWKRWERDGGLRLDNILLSSALTGRLQDAGVNRQTRESKAPAINAPV